MKVLIVIPTCDRKSALEECVASIIQHTLPSLYDIVVVDGSEKPSSLTPSYPEYVVYLRCPHNWGFTRAVNSGTSARRWRVYHALSGRNKLPFREGIK
jgi:GT2 family glycosyltransferase